jgi:predicted PurR-regulated permease PerM
MRLDNLESRVFAGLVLAISLFFVWMLRAFLQPIFWAMVFAVLFQPVHLRLVAALRGRRGAAALLSTVVVILAVVIPLGLLLAAVTQQGLWLYQRVASGDVDIHAPILFVERSLPRAAGFFAEYGVTTEQLRGALETAAIVVTQWIAGQALTLGQNALTVTILFVLMLYLLFFFFRDGDRIVQGVVRAVPMGDERERRLLAKFAEVSRATVKGTLVVAAVQGALGGILFSLVGIQAAIFWGVVMGILSLLPAVGPALVWLPAAIILASTGAYVAAVVVVVGGAVVVGLVDNVLRPILIGRETQMPDYLILLATLGGLMVFGIAGFVAGPIIASLFLVMWAMFADEYAPLDSSETGAVATATPDAALPPHSYGEIPLEEAPPVEDPVPDESGDHQPPA